MRIGSLITACLVGANIVLSLCFFAYAAVETTKFRESRKVLPTQIGQPKTKPSYWDDFQTVSSNIWLDIFLSTNPGMVPAPVAYDRMNKSGLDALKTRTRHISSGRNFDGSMSVNF
jgi:hypothetical protein